MTADARAVGTCLGAKATVQIIADCRYTDRDEIRISAPVKRWRMPMAKLKAAFDPI
jgi:hypothetical protein